MAKQEKERNYIQDLEKSNVKQVEIDGELKKSFIAYAMAVNVSRAIPDVRDGLKPVHRRILYSMNELNLTNDKPFRKCALIVGDVLGKYHPHGDSSVYDALVRLAQDFSIGCPLVDGHGNFGSVDGDPAAAYRYTEARLSKIASEMIRDIDKETVDMYPNFDDTRMQPVVLPARFPNLLVNGSDGIAVGMATNIPPHNLGEVIDATIALMRNPEMTVDELIEYVPAPDYPTGAIVLGRGGIRQAYRTGKGSVIIRSKTEIEELPSGKSRIIVTEIPYQVNKARLIENIADQVRDKRIEGIADVNEETDRTGMRIVIETKKDANAQVVLNTLFKQTQMQVSHGINLLALVDGTPKILNLKEVLENYVAHQEDVIIRRTKFDLEKAEERAHILEGLAIALASIDEVVETIKQSKDKNDAMDKLMSRFELSDKQANAVLEMKLQRLTSLEVEKIEEELDEKHKEIAEYKRILGSMEAVKEIIIEEMTEIRTKYASPRKSEISYDYSDIDIADLIEKEDVVVTLTHAGYVKRLPVAEYKSQHRGGKGITGHKAKEEDFVESMYTTNTHDDLLFFTNYGKVFSLKAYEIPEAQRTARGRAMVNLLQLNPGEKVTTMLPFREGQEGYLLLGTKLGLIKKTPLEEYRSIKKNGKIAITFNESDELIGATFTSGNDEILVGATNGNCIRFKETDVRPTSRTAMGVKSISLADGEEVVDIAVLKEGQEILTITENGFGKRSEYKDYPIQGRAGKGVKAGAFNSKTGKLVGLKILPEDMDVMIITDNGIIIRMEAAEISKFGRDTQGVRVMRLDDGYKIMSIALTPHEETEEGDDGEISVSEGQETAE
ncbi:MAG: DNA gyrase subunit A [Christensenellales bacterium]